jgi:hypothetical protein
MGIPPHSELLHTLIALTLVSLASILGSVSFALGKRLTLVIPYLVRAAAGALFGTALYNLLPEVLEHSVSSRRVGLLLAFGFLLSFVLERLLGMVFREKHAVMSAVIGSSRIHHTHEHNHASGKSLVTNVLLSAVLCIALSTGLASRWPLCPATPPLWLLRWRCCCTKFPITSQMWAS